MEVVGRDDEKKRLLELLENDKSNFLAVYGRRRIGKTYMLRNVYSKNLVFECTALNSIGKLEQLSNFCDVLINEYGFAIEKKPRNWIEAFRLLIKYLNTIKSTTKKVIFFDELPWFDTQRSGFVAAFGNFWNNYCEKRTDILLVICGSATSWILKNIVHNRGGLHNRLHQTIKLEPFTVKEMSQFLIWKKIKLAPKDIAQLYMCTGGVPYYLDHIKPGRSVPQILNDLFFTKNAYLKLEFENLYASLFKNYEKHITIIETLAKKNKGLTRQQIAKYGKQVSGGALTTAINELCECGFVDKAFGLNKKEDATFRLVDEYTLFYYKFINNNIGINGQTLATSQAYKTWSGFAFENFCLRHIEAIASALGISGVLYNTYSFVYKPNLDEAYPKGAQIDLIIDRADNIINLLEIKFYNGIYTITKQEEAILTNKRNCFIYKTKTKKSVFTTLITANGSEKNKYHLSVITNELQLIDLM